MRYLQDFAEKLALNVEYDTEVRQVKQWTGDGGKRVFHLLDQRGATRQCRTVVVW